MPTNTPALLLALWAATLLAPAGLACGYFGDWIRFDSDLPAAAVDADPIVAGDAISELRRAGQPGLQWLIDHHRSTIDGLVSGELDATAPEHARLIDALRRVAGQQDAHFAELYWYTDLATARAAADALGKPVLVLCLLGRLDETLSCANSRLFRAVLYPDDEVAAALRERFVLCWQTVMPVPVMTVDYGDGRQIVRTITGNSMHAVLGADGTVVDVLPGLVTPRVFVDWLVEAEQRAVSGEALPAMAEGGALDAERAAALLGYTRERAAEVAMRRTMSKMVMELPVFDAGLLPRGGTTDAGAPPTLADRLSAASAASALGLDPMAGAADMMLNETRLSPRSLALITAQHPGMDAGTREVMVAGLVRSTVRDAAYNRAVLQPVARRWLTETPRGFEATVEWAYRDLFATPVDDPWMGLDVPGVYTGLPGGGLFDAGDGAATMGRG